MSPLPLIFIYEIDKDKSPYSPVIDWQKRLTISLRVQLVEEVDDRVSKTVEKVFMDKGNSGWKNQETPKTK